MGKQKIMQSILSYVHSCRVDDGGYFFARIRPGSLLDTCYAVKILANIGTSPEHPGSLKEFVSQHVENSSNRDIHALYLASEILRQLGEISDLRRMSSAFGLRTSGPALSLKPDGLYIEVSSELRHVFEYVALLRNLDIDVNETGLADYICSLQNDDGGYGSGRSSLATTYYAIEMLDLLKVVPEERGRMLEFLKRRENGVYFLEDLFYLVHVKSALEEGNDGLSDKTSFVLDCQRAGGGFARARAIGIPTLEYTYYAVSVLDRLAFFNKVKEGEQMK